jgi:epoxyqueuosine reductase
MGRMEAQLKSLATSLGAELVGITNRRALADGPPSADARYLLPSAESVISFAISLDSRLACDFISKNDWRSHCENRKEVARKLYRVGDGIAEFLSSQGFEATNVEVNGNYRVENGSDDVTEMTEFHPDFAHRYAAVAAGVGRLGWSGNLLTKRYGALVELGSVLTSAFLQPDGAVPDAEHPCDRCRMCSAVCPVEMIHPSRSCQVSVAGVTETISKKRPNTCCWIGCTGYEGLSRSSTWSNWSPYRLGRPLPEDKNELDALCVRLQKADPQMRDPANSLCNYREAVFDPDWFYYTVCGFCRSVCAPDKKDRLNNRKLIVNSGTAALKMDGSHQVAGDDCVEFSTPYGMNVVIKKETAPARQERWPGQFPLDREAIAHVMHQLKLAEDGD